MRQVALAATLLFLALQQRAAASPPPRLTWETGSVWAKVPGIGPVRIEVECPAGVLKKLAVTAGGQSAAFPIAKLKGLDMPPTCSGLNTSLELEGEAGGKAIGLSLTLDFTSEYDRRELFLLFDFAKGTFTIAKWQVQSVGQLVQVTAIPL